MVGLVVCRSLALQHSQNSCTERLNRLRHKPNPSAHTTPAKKKTSPSANEDWIESFPKIAHEAEIPVQASQDHIDENNNTAPLIIEVKWVPA